MLKSCIYLLLILLKFTVVFTGNVTIADTTITSEDSHNKDSKLKNETHDSIKKIAGLIGTPSTSSNESICVFVYKELILEKKLECFDNKFTNVTENLYLVYSNANKTNGILNLSDLSKVSQQFNNFQGIDYYIFLKCLLLLPTKVSDARTNLANIVSNALDSDFSSRNSYLFAQKLYLMLYNMETDFSIVNSNLVFAAWYPFLTDITGFAIYKESYVSEIYINQSIDDISTNKLEIAGYVPHDFLDNLAYSLPNDGKEKLRVIMLMVMDTTKYQSFFNINRKLKYFIGVSIPGFCKTNDLPMITAYFGSKWMEFGVEYRDSMSDYDWYKCVLKRMSYFGQLNTTGKRYYESVKEKYCLPYTASTTSGKLSFRQTMINHRMYPEKFCMNNKLKIPIAFCTSGPLYRFVERDIKCSDHPVSNKTQELYNVLINRSMSRKSIKNLNSSNNIVDNVNSVYVYADVKLYFDIFISLRKIQASVQEIALLSNMLNKVLKMIEEQSHKYYQLTYVSVFLQSFLYSLPKNYFNEVLIKPNYIYETFRPSEKGIVGLILYNRNHSSFENYEIKQLTMNSTKDYSYNDTVEAIIYLSEDISNLTFDANSYDTFAMSIFIIHSDHLTEDENCQCKSRIVGIHHFASESRHFEFKIYLKATDGSNEGYWSTIESDKGKLKLVFISAARNDSTKKMLVFEDDAFFDVDMQPRSNVACFSKISVYLVLLLVTIFPFKARYL